MAPISTPTLGRTARLYCSLTKPGIIFGNIVTTAGGFALASRGHIQFWLLFEALLGISLVIASACVFNNYIDRHADQRMRRTKNRAFASGLIAVKPAILFAVTLGLLGVFFLAAFVNFLAALIATIGFFVYVVVYSLSKYHTAHGTLIGSVAGAVPPVVGYCAVSGRLDIGALLIFAIVVLWQMPHFFAISIYRLGDYSAASIPVLPAIKGMQTTKVHMFLYILAFTVVSFLPTAFHYVGYTYLISAALIGFTWLALAAQGFKCDDDTVWARKMFIFSLIAIMGLCLAIPFSAP